MRIILIIYKATLHTFQISPKLGVILKLNYLIKAKLHIEITQPKKAANVTKEIKFMTEGCTFQYI